VRYADAVEDFLATCVLREMSRGTVQGYRYDLGRLGRFLAGRAVDEVEQVTPAHLRAFLGSTAVGSAARARYRASTRSLFHFLSTEGVLTRNPSLSVPAVARPHYLPRSLDAAQVVKALAAVEDSTLRGLFTLVAETGLRISEALHLGVTDVHLAEGDGAGWLRILGKGRRERVVPLLVAPLSVPVLAAQVAGRRDGPVFRRSGRRDTDTGPYSYDAARAAWRRACRRAGLGPLHIHQLRHTFASRLVAAEVPIVTVQKLLGHQSLDTTMRYAAITDTLVRRDLETAGGRIGLGPGGPAGGERHDATP